MIPWKDVLCLLAIFVAYGLAGHLDYQDAVAMEEATRSHMPPHCSAPSGAGAEHASLSPADAMSVRVGASAAISHPVCGPFDQ